MPPPQPTPVWVWIMKIMSGFFCILSAEQEGCQLYVGTLCFQAWRPSETAGIILGPQPLNPKHLDCRFKAAIINRSMHTLVWEEFVRLTRNLCETALMEFYSIHLVYVSLVPLGRRSRNYIHLIAMAFFHGCSLARLGVAPVVPLSSNLLIPWFSCPPIPWFPGHFRECFWSKVKRIAGAKRRHCSARRPSSPKTLLAWKVRAIESDPLNAAAQGPAVPDSFARRLVFN